ncbi:MAG: hypothetical protein K2Y42_12630 [Hyphomicrobium sp.]|jgi:hypothetical protein|uniref:hypothetical protein n=1 Tax=Hyphomicrobium sp. TaxID=82 RepID=UPI0025C01DF6|nr:hypothetical protein [Hyphomicrobium sp.]MBX9863584.1 hypothetical protein [Hyphomicrobium sp.]
MKAIVSVWGGADGFDYLASFTCSENDAIEIVREELHKGNRVTLHMSDDAPRGFVFDRRETMH